MFSEKIRMKIEEPFLQQMHHLEELSGEVFTYLQKCDRDIADAIKWLYAAMPVSDAVDYPFYLILEYAEHGVFLYHHGPFANKIPLEIFLNYVLLHRVNNEDIVSCRKYFYELLHKEIENCDMTEAAKRINYWCAQEVTYRASDERTISAITAYRSGFGRCGEESTFAVSVFRGLGIPARQVYVPLWSHCDDNHAWVEVWCDGGWHYLGACEPEEILDKGWFTNAASRAMMIHSRWFGLTQPQDAIVGKKGIATIINHLQWYAQVKEITIKVQDEKKQPCAGVTVCYEVLNYSEFGNVAATTTDQMGQTSIMTGLGSIHISAHVGELYADYLMNTQKEEQCILILESIKTKLDTWKERELIAPIDCVPSPVVLTKEEKRRNEQRLNEAAQKRRNKITQFYKTEEAKEVAADFSGYKEEVLLILKKASGNFSEIKDYLHRIKEQKLDVAMGIQLLLTLSDKDYLDVKADMLLNHLKAIARYKDSYPEDIFTSYILCPRVQFERLTDDVGFLKHYLQDKKEILQMDPKDIWNYIDKQIVSIPEKEYGQLITSITGCFKSGVGSRLSKEILSIRILRYSGIPARMNPIDGTMEYYSNGEFVPVENKKLLAKSCVMFEGDSNTKWKYSQNWSLGKWSENGFQTLQLYGDITTDKLGALDLEDGIYRVITSNRLPNGNIFAKENCFEVNGGQDTRIELSMKQAELSQMLEEIELPDFELQWEQQEVSARELAGSPKMLFLWLEVNREPTEHILNELYEISDQINKLGTKIYFVLKKEEDLQDVTFNRTIKVLENVEIVFNSSKTNAQILARRMYVDPDKLPLIIVIKEGFLGTYATSGYNVGTADMLMRILNAD
ncbi:Transglutaminase-like superfamily protein [Anaerocolumna jejuensis DSM 15929]|uniref:Transglutaminase-like superfamily protein n=1 Tax=Anaerocolumna jejuensis DSM 15929 TaxID=1121322 RepID=A0A1M6Z8B5_9FIRM|nr:transglutaminase-like domain-containing protein [Anaerocolumna jejuensis]SHL26714.1 Transglutaminase-like superfamily protein [Anaerocolumna jejuensis DSM 15929]